jgi:DNA-binding beta-propeller fold protein YncE
MHGVAVDAATGYVYTGNGEDETISEVDPVAMRVRRTSPKLGGAIDAIVFDPAARQIYADEDDGTHMYIVDTVAMQPRQPVTLPGHKPEYLQVDDDTHLVYQNIDDLGEIAVIDPTTEKILRTIPTPQFTHNHPLQFDYLYHVLVAGGTGGAAGILASYAMNASVVSQIAVPRFDQCDLDPIAHALACAGGGGITRIRIGSNGVLTVLDTTPVAAGVHTVAVDPKTHAVYTVWSDRATGQSFAQAFSAAPSR